MSVQDPNAADKLAKIQSDLDETKVSRLSESRHLTEYASVLIQSAAWRVIVCDQCSELSKSAYAVAGNIQQSAVVFLEHALRCCSMNQSNSYVLRADGDDGCSQLRAPKHCRSRVHGGTGGAAPHHREHAGARREAGHPGRQV